MSEALIKALLAYALGNVMGGQIVGLLRGGIDLRRLGSGNVGATNALRTQGLSFGLSVLLIDVLKGLLAAWLLPALPWFGAQAWPRAWVAYACGIGVALGHCYPMTLGFRGGKGVATLAGVFLAVMPFAMLWILSVFALVVMLSGYVSLATIAASVTALFYAACIDSRGLISALGAFTAAMFALVLFKHRANLMRLWRGSEPRFEKARVLGRRFDPKNR